MTQRLAELASSSLPLHDGLRAAAAEAPTRRLAITLEAFAADLERGRPLEEVARDAVGKMPRTVGGLLLAAAKTGRFGEVLGELIQHQRRIRQLRRSITGALIYPGLLLAATTLLIFSLQQVVVVGVINIAIEFEIELKPVTQALVWWSNVGSWMVLWTVIGIAVLCVAIRLFAGPARWSRIYGSVPIFGPVSRWSAVAAWSRLMTILLDQDVPLPTALRLAADGSGNAGLAADSRGLATAAEEQGSLSKAMAAGNRWPPLLKSLVVQGERNQSLADSLRAAAEIYECRVQMRASMLRAILPPLVFVFVGMLLSFIATGMIMPLMQMVNMLSWNSDQELPLTAHGGLLNLAGLVILGGALLWAVMLIYGRRERVSDDWIKRVMTIGGWMLILAGILGVVLNTHGPMLYLFLPLVIVVLIIVLSKFRYAERRALIWSMGVAIERGIPLPEALRAIAGELSDQIGLRAWRAADLLQSGGALPRALRISHNQLPMDARIAVDFGYHHNCLSPAIRCVIDENDPLESHLGALYEKCLYLSIVFAFAVGALCYLLVRFVPMVDRNLRDLDLEVPQATQVLFHVARHFSLTWYVYLPIAVLLLVSLVLGLLVYVGRLPRSFPFVGWLSLRTDSATVLKLLGLAVERRQPLGEAIQFLADHHPNPNLRHRLLISVQETTNGMDWCESLKRNGIIKPVDVAVLQAAGRVGNLAWAMAEMSDRIKRQMVYRTTALLNLAFPGVVMAVALLCFSIVMGVMGPLIELISKMSVQ